MQPLTTIEGFELWELEAYAEGVEMPAVAAFVSQQSERWAAWLAAYRQEAAPFAKLGRVDCPAPARLRDYYWGMGSLSEQETIRHHLTLCPDCSEERRRLQEFVGPLPAGPSASAPSTFITSLRALQDDLEQSIQRMGRAFAEQMRVVVATLIPPVSPQLASVALRSDESKITQGSTTLSSDPAPLLFEAELIDISLLIQRNLPDQVTIHGQLLALQPVTYRPVKLLPAQTDLPLQQSSVTSAGVFRFDKVRPGTYQLVIALQEDVIVVIPELVVR